MREHERGRSALLRADRRENGLTHSTWSIGGTRFSEPHPFPDAARVRHQTYSDPAPIFVPIAGPTYLDLWRACDEAIERSVNSSIDTSKSSDAKSLAGRSRSPTRPSCGW